MSEELIKAELLQRLRENIESLLMTENLSEGEKLSLMSHVLQIISYGKEEVEKQ